MKKRLFSSVGAAMLLAGCGMAGDTAGDATSAMAANNHQAAKIHLAEKLRENPQDHGVRLDLARANLALGDGIAAEATLEKLPAQMLETGESAALMAHAKLLRSDYADAAEWAAKAGEDNALGQWVIVATHLAQNEIQPAIAAADAALERLPKDARLLATRGELALHARQIDRARLFSDRAIAADPNELSSMMLAGRLDLMDRQFKKARDHFHAAAKQHPLAVAPLISLAAVEADMGNFDKAREALEHLAKIAPGHPVATLLAARIDFRDGDLDAAHDTMSAAENELRKVPAAQLMLGEIAHLRGNQEMAIAMLRRFMKDNPGHVHGATVLAQAYLAQGDERDAWEAIQLPAKRATATPQLLALAARLANSLGEEDTFTARLARGEISQDAAPQMAKANQAMRERDWKTARDIYRAMRKSGLGNNAIVLNNAALAELNTGNSAEALQLARGAFALTPEDPQVMDTLGWVLLKSGGSKPEALSLLRSAQQKLPGNLQIRWHYANALAANGQRGEAKRIIASFRDFAAPEQREHIDRLMARL